MYKIDKESLKKLGVPEKFKKVFDNVYYGEDRRIYALKDGTMHFMTSNDKPYCALLNPKASFSAMDCQIDEYSLKKLGVPDEFHKSFDNFYWAEGHEIYELKGNMMHLLPKGSKAYRDYLHKKKVNEAKDDARRSLSARIFEYETKESEIRDQLLNERNWKAGRASEKQLKEELKACLEKLSALRQMSKELGD